MVGCKQIADFGLSRSLKRKQSVVEDPEEPLYYRSAQSNLTFPIRWSPPEVFRGGKFTVASDVWSFGILLWELWVKCQCSPFPEFPTNKEVEEQVLLGYKMKKPDGCPAELYQQLILPCWSLEPSLRPSFDTVRNRIIELFPNVRKSVVPPPETSPKLERRLYRGTVENEEPPPPQEQDSAENTGKQEEENLHSVEEPDSWKVLEELWKRHQEERLQFERRQQEEFSNLCKRLSSRCNK